MKYLKYIIPIIACFIISCKTNKVCLTPDSYELRTDSVLLVVNSNSYKGIVFDSKYQYSKLNYLSIKPKPWNPNCVDINVFEKTLSDSVHLLKYNLDKYKRQYFGFSDSLNNETYIYCRLVYDPNSVISFAELSHRLLYVYDSDAYATVIINLKNKLIIIE